MPGAVGSCPLPSRPRSGSSSAGSPASRGSGGRRRLRPRARPPLRGGGRPPGLRGTGKAPPSLHAALPRPQPARSRGGGRRGTGSPRAHVPFPGRLPRRVGFRTWIFRLCSTAAADLVRNRARDRSRLRRYAATLPDLDPRPEDEPPFDLERLERARETRRALASLGEPDASLLFLRDAEGLSVEELSSVFGLREGTVKSRLSRARRRLRGLLEEEGESNPGRMPWGK